MRHKAGPFRSPAFVQVGIDGRRLLGLAPKAELAVLAEAPALRISIRVDGYAVTEATSDLNGGERALERTGVKCQTLLQFILPEAWPHSFQPQPLTKPLVSTTIGMGRAARHVDALCRLQAAGDARRARDPSIVFIFFHRISSQSSVLRPAPGP